MSTPLRALAEHGQSPWIDYLYREFVHGGDLAALIGEGVIGVTSNPTIFQAAIAEGDAYDEQLREVLADRTDPKEVFLALAREDIRAACDLLGGDLRAVASVASFFVSRVDTEADRRLEEVGGPAMVDVNRLGQTRETMPGWDIDAYAARPRARLARHHRRRP